MLRRAIVFGSALALAVLIVKFGQLLLLFIGIAILAPFVIVLVNHRRRSRLLRAFRATHGAAGKDLLLVYTDSPHWRPYIEEHWVRRWEKRAVIFNRSEPWQPGQLESRLWRSMAGILEHTPVAIVIPARGRPSVIRFFRAFRDFKHHKERRLHEAERALESALAASSKLMSR
jgi:hypothetical protein